MRQTFRLNVVNKGYTLFSGSDSTYIECPLDIYSFRINKNYLFAQQRLEDLFWLFSSQWHLSISHKHKNEFPTVAYGKFFPNLKDGGRNGISYIHAIDSNDQYNISTIVQNIVLLLSQPFLKELNTKIENVLSGVETPENLIDSVKYKFLNSTLIQANYAVLPKEPPTKIYNDCGGASSISWLIMATSHSNINESWEVYEEYDPQKKSVVMISTFPIKPNEIYISNYIFNLIENDLLPIKYLSSDQERTEQSSLVSLPSDQYISEFNLPEKTSTSSRKNQAQQSSLAQIYYEQNLETHSNYNQDISNELILDQISNLQNSLNKYFILLNRKNISKSIQPTRNEDQHFAKQIPLSNNKSHEQINICSYLVRKIFPSTRNIIQKINVDFLIIQNSILYLQSEQSKFVVSVKNFLGYEELDSSHEFLICKIYLFGFRRKKIKLVIKKNNLESIYDTSINSFGARLNSIKSPHSYFNK